MHMRRQERSPLRVRFNEAAGADPADASAAEIVSSVHGAIASMRPRGQTPRMPAAARGPPADLDVASMRPRGQTPRMRLVQFLRDDTTDRMLQ